MNRRTALLLLLAAFLLGLLSTCSVRFYDRSFGEARQNLQRAKADLLGSPRVDRAHHQVFARVGPLRWERDVKPAILSELTWRTIHDTGNLFPDIADIVRWTQRHPRETELIIRRHGGTSQ